MPAHGVCFRASMSLPTTNKMISIAVPAAVVRKKQRHDAADGAGSDHDGCKGISSNADRIGRGSQQDQVMEGGLDARKGSCRRTKPGAACQRGRHMELWMSSEMTLLNIHSLCLGSPPEHSHSAREYSHIIGRKSI